MFQCLSIVAFCHVDQFKGCSSTIQWSCRTTMWKLRLGCLASRAAPAPSSQMQPWPASARFLSGGLSGHARDHTVVIVLGTTHLRRQLQPYVLPMTEASKFGRRFCTPSVAGTAASGGWNGLVFSFGVSADVVES